MGKTYTAVVVIREQQLRIVCALFIYMKETKKFWEVFVLTLASTQSPSFLGSHRRVSGLHSGGQCPSLASVGFHLCSFQGAI